MNYPEKFPKLHEILFEIAMDNGTYYEYVTCDWEKLEQLVDLSPL